jgi:hypothetical protein
MAHSTSFSHRFGGTASVCYGKEIRNMKQYMQQLLVLAVLTAAAALLMTWALDREISQNERDLSLFSSLTKEINDRVNSDSSNY